MLKCLPYVIYKSINTLVYFRGLGAHFSGEWETHTQAETDGEGWLTLKGFKGDYQLSGESGSAKVTIGAGSELEIRLM